MIENQRDKIDKLLWLFSRTKSKEKAEVYLKQLKEEKERLLKMEEADGRVERLHK